MASNAISGVGTLFRRWSGSEWVNIAEVNSITGPSMTRETIDVTSLDSTGGYREFIAGFRDAGTVVLNMNFSRTNYDTMKDDFESDDLQQYEIMLPDDENTSVEFEGLVTELPLTIAAADKISMDVTIKISGQPETDSGSGSS